MKIHQIPAIHSMIKRWRHPQNNRSASDPELDASTNTNTNGNSHPVRVPPSPKSPSKKSVRISEVESPPRHNSSVKGKGREVPTSGPAASMPQLPSPPPSPRIQLRSRSSNRCCSGEPVTHPQVGEVSKKCGPVHVHETFECQDAVEPVRLLTLSRRTLVDEARARGGNALVDESWEYTVSKRGKSGYTVKVDYSAGAVFITGEGAHDPQKPVAIEVAKTQGVTGLMTVTSRH